MIKLLQQVQAELAAKHILVQISAFSEELRLITACLAVEDCLKRIEMKQILNHQFRFWRGNVIGGPNSPKFGDVSPVSNELTPVNVMRVTSKAV